MRHIYPSLTLLSAVIYSLLFSGCRAETVVRTIDDTDPTVSFSDSSWNNQNCVTCSAKPSNASLAFNGTWHEDTRETGGPKWVSIQFNGTGISAYAILPSNVTGGPAIKNLDVDIFFDGREASCIEIVPTSQDYEFNTQIFSVSGQDNASHNLTLVLNVNSLLMIDYFNVTSEVDTSTPTSSSASTSALSATALSADSTGAPPSPSPSPSPAPHSGLTAGAIAGIAIGAIACCALVVTATIFLRGVRSEAALLQSPPNSRPGVNMLRYPGASMSRGQTSTTGQTTLVASHTDYAGRRR